MSKRGWDFRGNIVTSDGVDMFNCANPAAALAMARYIDALEGELAAECRAVAVMKDIMLSPYKICDLQPGETYASRIEKITADAREGKLPAGMYFAPTPAEVSESHRADPQPITLPADSHNCTGPDCAVPFCENDLQPADAPDAGSGKMTGSRYEAETSQEWLAKQPASYRSAGSEPAVCDARCAGLPDTIAELNALYVGQMRTISRYDETSMQLHREHLLAQGTGKADAGEVQPC